MCSSIDRLIDVSNIKHHCFTLINIATCIKVSVKAFYLTIKINLCPLEKSDP